MCGSLCVVAGSAFRDLCCAVLRHVAVQVVLRNLPQICLRIVELPYPDVRGGLLATAEGALPLARNVCTFPFPLKPAGHQVARANSEAVCRALPRRNPTVLTATVIGEPNLKGGTRTPLALP